MSNFYNQASWVLVPSGIEEDIVFAQKPISGLGDLTFTRASDATYTDASGVVRRSPYNLLTFSEDFSNVAWTKTSATITANTTTAPNGTLTADLFTKISAVNTTSQVSNFSSVYITTGAHTLSVYIKPNVGNTVLLRLDNAGNTANFTFNFTTKTFSNTGANVISSSFDELPNGWFRLRVTGNVTSTSWALTPCNLFVNPTNDSMFIWGAQLVEGTSALDYFPTTNRQDVPRIDFRNADGTLSSCGRLLLEPQRTNSIRNSSMVGAVAGSPGTLPTNWTNLVTGLTRTIVGTGTENGLPYIDFRFNGTATGIAVRIDFETSTGIAASNTQTWTNSLYAKIISAPTPPTSYSLVTIERTSAGSFVTEGEQIFTPTTTLQRFSLTRTLSGGATVAAVQPGFYARFTSGVAYDFTIRIAAPQMELGAYATTWVPTTTAAVTRLADTASKTGVSSLIGQTQGTLFIDINYNQPTSDANGRLLQVYGTSDVTNSILPLIQGIGANANQFQLTTYSGGVINIPITPSVSTVVPFGRQKFAIAYNAGAYTIYRNGALFASGTGTAPVSLTALELGSTTFTTRNLSNPINQAALFPTRLTNAELAQLTTL